MLRTILLLLVVISTDFGPFCLNVFKRRISWFTVSSASSPAAFAGSNAAFAEMLVHFSLVAVREYGSFLVFMIIFRVTVVHGYRTKRNNARRKWALCVKIFCSCECLPVCCHYNIYFKKNPISMLFLLRTYAYSNSSFHNSYINSIK